MTFILSLLMLPIMNSVGNYQPVINSVHVIEMYFNTCPYCNYNAPNVDDLADFYKSNGRVQVLDVGIDRSDSDYQSWIKKHSPNHPVLKDAQRQVAKALGTSSYPSTYVVNCRGEVKFKSVGEWDSSTEMKIKSAVDEALTVECDTI